MSNAPTDRDFGYNQLSVARCFYVAILVAEAYDLIGFSHIDVLRIGSGRIESNPERPVQTVCKDISCLRLRCLSLLKTPKAKEILEFLWLSEF